MTNIKNVNTNNSYNTNTNYNGNYKSFNSTSNVESLDVDEALVGSSSGYVSKSKATEMLKARMNAVHNSEPDTTLIVNPKGIETDSAGHHYLTFTLKDHHGNSEIFTYRVNADNSVKNTVHYQENADGTHVRWREGMGVDSNINGFTRANAAAFKNSGNTIGVNSSNSSNKSNSSSYVSLSEASTMLRNRMNEIKSLNPGYTLIENSKGVETDRAGHHYLTFTLKDNKGNSKTYTYRVNADNSIKNTVHYEEYANGTHTRWREGMGVDSNIKGFTKNDAKSFKNSGDISTKNNTSINNSNNTNSSNQTNNISENTAEMEFDSVLNAYKSKYPTATITSSKIQTDKNGLYYKTFNIKESNGNTRAYVYRVNSDNMMEYVYGETRYASGKYISVNNDTNIKETGTISNGKKNTTSRVNYSVTIKSATFGNISNLVLGTGDGKKSTGNVGENTITKTAEGNVIYLSNLVANDKSMEATLSNTNKLQDAIDKVSESGGGTVEIPAGTFYFKCLSTNTGSGQNYYIKLKSHVHIKGAGQDKTIIKQYGDELHEDGTSTKATAMFYRNNYRETNGADTSPLEDADFSDFTIDGGEYHYTEPYNTGGQTFGIKIYKDCDFKNITIKNSPATGFGCDSPINSTFTNCYAENCGRQATSTSQGASGFGIGTGFSNDESVKITNCRAVDCTKYGFFFEHQGVFQRSDQYLFPATKGNFVVENCTAKGNKYDFGARRGNDVHFISCVSEAPTTSEEMSRNKAAFFSEQHSKRVTYENCTTNRNFEDVSGSDYDVALWATENGILTGNSPTKFGANQGLTRGQVLTMLYKFNNEPGTIYTHRDLPSETKFTDVKTTDSAYDAIVWGTNNGIASGTSATTFAPNNACSYKNFMTFLWRSAGSPNVSTTDTSYYGKAIAWANQTGISSGVNESLDQTITKLDAAKILKNYSNLK